MADPVLELEVNGSAMQVEVGCAPGDHRWTFEGTFGPEGSVTAVSFRIPAMSLEQLRAIGALLYQPGRLTIRYEVRHG